VAATPLDILEDHEHTLWVDIELDIVMDIGLDVVWPYRTDSSRTINLPVEAGANFTWAPQLVQPVLVTVKREIATNQLELEAIGD